MDHVAIIVLGCLCAILVLALISVVRSQDRRIDDATSKLVEMAEVRGWEPQLASRRAAQSPRPPSPDDVFPPEPAPPPGDDITANLGTKWVNLTRPGGGSS